MIPIPISQENAGDARKIRKYSKHVQSTVHQVTKITSSPPPHLTTSPHQRDETSPFLPLAYRPSNFFIIDSLAFFSFHTSFLCHLPIHDIAAMYGQVALLFFPLLLLTACASSVHGPSSSVCVGPHLPFWSMYRYV